ncbi:MAG TPA: HD domain-containing protein [Chloroflexota bacterium]|nr:HD domain-containing protein [Chloroflexota bacterium]
MSLAESVLSERDRAVLTELEVLTRETYQLWNEIWVGFSWRNYTYDHVMRVRNLARTVATRESGDVRTLEFAATLHDITKSYDGEILMRDGQRVLDPDGFWINAKLPPVRQNRVTDLYERLELEGTVHHHSGGQIATALLSDYGYDTDFCASVREMISAHLKPTDTSSRAGLSLYDADTVDANIGLPAFYRNIQISMHRMDGDYAKRGEDLVAFLNQNLRDYLLTYLTDRIPTWNEGKRRDFVPKLWTETGRRVANDRVDYLAGEVEGMVAELNDFDHNVTHGRLALVRRFIVNRNNPSLTAELADLEAWASDPETTPEARVLLARYRAEVAGEV